MGQAVVLDLPLAFVISNTGPSKTLVAINVDTKKIAWYNTQTTTHLFNITITPINLDTTKHLNSIFRTFTFLMHR